jgi:antitoxin StbD
MEQVLASRSVSITELKRSPSAVLEQAGLEPVAVLNHNRPAAYLLSPQVYEAMLERLNADLVSPSEGARRRSGHSCSRSACRTECALRRA